MDFSAFSNDNFDMKEWINTAFASEEASKNKEAYLGTLVMKLQLFIQEINNSLEETGHQVLQNVPRILRDVEAIQQEAILLRDQMRTVKEEIKRVEHDTALSMQTLVKIDAVKNRMIDTNKALQEADNWTSLSSDVEEVMSTNDIAKIAEKLVGMQQSLEILSDVPDYEERCQHLEKLKDRLEAMISPQLIAALNSNSHDLAQIYLTTFKDVNRLDQFWKYYHKCHKSQILKTWKSIVNTDSDENLIDWLNAFYDKLLSLWHVETRWCQCAVPNSSPIKILSQIYHDALQSLEPSIGYCITAELKSPSPSSNFVMLNDLKQISDRFAKSLQTSILSFDQKSLGSKEIKDLVHAIYEPYVSYTLSFGELISKMLFEQLQPIDLVKEDALDSLRYFEDSVNKVIKFVQEACDHCKLFTAGCSYASVISAVSNFFDSYLKKVNRVCDQLKDNADSVVNYDDSANFQLILQALQCCGDLLSKLETFEQDLISAIIESGHLNGIYVNEESSIGGSVEDNPFKNYKEFLLDSDGQTKMKNLVKNVNANATSSVLPNVVSKIQKLCSDFCRILFSVMFDPINKQLTSITSPKLWSEKKGSALTDDLPTFSMSPQEYITQIGQHLITLPQHIEPFVVDDNPSLQLALKNGKLPYMLDQHSSHLADVLLGSVAHGTAQTYCDTIIRIESLSLNSVKQLVTDIEYLFNVLDDLGLKPNDTDSLQIILTLLNCSHDQYAIVSHGKPAHLVNSVRRIRDI